MTTHGTETHQIAGTFANYLFNGKGADITAAEISELEEWLAINDLDGDPLDTERHGPGKCAITGLIADCEAVTWHIA